MRMPSTAAALAAPLMMILSAACSSSGTAPAQETGLDRTLPQVENRETNSYGVQYPTTDIGTAARKGSVAGQRIKNFKFLGYVNGDVTAPLTTVALVDYFDPQQKIAPAPVKLIHIQAAGRWCVYCQNEVKDLTPQVEELRNLGVVWITTVAEGGTPGTASKLDDLNKWIAAYKVQNTTVLDPGNANLGIFYKAAALPWNAWIDARSMEIVSYLEGYGGNIRKEVDKELTAWDARPVKE